MDFKVCRGCLAPEDKTKFTSIFAQKGKLAEFIFELTNLEIPNQKQAPALLCTKCVKELKQAVSIRDSIIKNHQNFADFYSNSSTADPLTERLQVKTEETENCSMTNLDVTVDVSLFKKFTLTVDVVKNEPVDCDMDVTDEYPDQNSTNCSSSDDSTSDELPLTQRAKNFKKPKLKDDSQQTKTFLCQRCGQIAENTCKVCKTKVISKHEQDKIKQRERIIQTFLDNPTVKSMTKLARLADAPRTTVRRTIESYKSNEIRTRKAGSGRKSGTGDREREKKIIEACKVNPELSIRQLARMFGTCPSNVQRIKVRHGLIWEKKNEVKKTKRKKDRMEEDSSGNLSFGILADHLIGFV